MTTPDRNVAPRRAARVDPDTILTEDETLNRDPITGTPGAHPVGTGVGAASGGVVGAGIGSLAGGPIGAAIGAVAGAVVGGMAGKAAAEGLDPTVEEEYWRSNFESRPYVAADSEFDDYRPAYRHGWESWAKRSAATPRPSFDDTEAELRAEWEGMKDKAALKWDRAKAAVRDAWDRVDGADRGRRGR